MRIKMCVLLVFIVLLNIRILAQGGRMVVQLDFCVRGTQIDSTFRDNAFQLSRLASFLECMEQDSMFLIEKVIFYGTASPEGCYQLNKQLARKRLATLESFVRERLKIPDRCVVRDCQYINWSRLTSMTRESNIPYKEKVVEILGYEEEFSNYGKGLQIDNRVLLLQSLYAGRMWQLMYKRFFDSMRNAGVLFILAKDKTFSKKMTPITVPISSLPLLLKKVPSEFGAKEGVNRSLGDDIQKRNEYSLYLKTNAVGLGMLISNLAVELAWGQYWSFVLPVYYSGVNYFTSTIKFRTFCVQPELRYWFGGNDGIFMGVHAGFAYYNFALNGKWRIQDHSAAHPALGGGVSVGYRLPIGKSNHWNAEFSLGAGVYSLYYDKFHNKPDGRLSSSVRDVFFGIDQVAISLSYKLNFKTKQK